MTEFLMGGKRKSVSSALWCVLPWVNRISARDMAMSQHAVSCEYCGSVCRLQLAPGGVGSVDCATCQRKLFARSAHSIPEQELFGESSSIDSFRIPQAPPADGVAPHLVALPCVQLTEFTLSDARGHPVGMEWLCDVLGGPGAEEVSAHDSEVAAAPPTSRSAEALPEPSADQLFGDASDEATAETSGDASANTSAQAAAQNGTEQNGTEQNGTERLATALLVDALMEQQRDEMRKQGWKKKPSAPKRPKSTKPSARDPKKASKMSKPSEEGVAAVEVRTFAPDSSDDDYILPTYAPIPAPTLATADGLFGDDPMEDDDDLPPAAAQPPPPGTAATAPHTPA